MVLFYGMIFMHEVVDLLDRYIRPPAILFSCSVMHCAGFHSGSIDGDFVYFFFEKGTFVVGDGG